VLARPCAIGTLVLTWAGCSDGEAGTTLTTVATTPTIAPQTVVVTTPAPSLTTTRITTVRTTARSGTSVAQTFIVGATTPPPTGPDGSTLPPLTATPSSGPADPSATSVTPGSLEPGSTTIAPAPSTDAPTTIPVPTTTAIPPLVRMYEPMSPPLPPDVSTPVPTNPDGELPDGTYYGSIEVVEDGVAEITLYQLFHGAACLAKAAEIGDTCLDDYLVLDEPSYVMETDVTSVELITVAAIDEPELNYRITGEELERLGRGDDPADGAPPGFTYTSYPVIVSVRGGVVEKLEQWWVP
jgi:hypothetical protein